MEEGSFRCDANISIKPKGSNTFMSKVEVKNMNSFRAVHRALEYEIERQTSLVQQGGRVAQETRGWVEDKGITVSMRSKEFAHDYRFFPEPDLPSITINQDWVTSIAEHLPELPDAKKQRYLNLYGIQVYDAEQLTSTPAIAAYYESVIRERESRLKETSISNEFAKAAANWTITELSRLLNANEFSIDASPFTPSFMVDLLELIEGGIIGTAQAKTTFEEAFRLSKSPKAVVEDLGLTQISDSETLNPIVSEIITANPQAVEDYLSGKESAVKYLVGQTMKATQGKANPALVAEVIQSQLNALK